MNKHDKIRNGWNIHEDRLALKGREEGLTGAQISEKYLPHRTLNAINLRLNKLNANAYGQKKKDVYYIKPGLAGCEFEMPAPIKLDEYNTQGSAEHSMFGHVIYEA
jgi:hypothetical protein